MAQHHEIFAMILGGRRMDLHKGFIVELSRDAEIFARIRVETLEDANQLEAIAARVEGSWMPNYRYEGKALSVTEFVEKVTNDPKAFSQPLAVEKPKKAPAPTPSKPGRPSSASALDKIRSFAEAREADHVVVRDGLTYGDCRAITTLVQTIGERARDLESLLVRPA